MLEFDLTKARYYDWKVKSKPFSIISCKINNIASAFWRNS
jgi:hypothetical protein